MIDLWIKALVIFWFNWCRDDKNLSLKFHFKFRTMLIVCVIGKKRFFWQKTSFRVWRQYIRLLTLILYSHSAIKKCNRLQRWHFSLKRILTSQWGCTWRTFAIFTWNPVLFSNRVLRNFISWLVLCFCWTQRMTQTQELLLFPFVTKFLFVPWFREHLVC